jgi:exopolysaccharide biosynthesis polyprenyl glycosylphosphotransferase
MPNMPEISRLGELGDAERIIHEKEIRVVVLALEHKHTIGADQLLQTLSRMDVQLKMVPGTLDILSGSVRTSNVLGTAFIDIRTDLLPAWQQHAKRAIDIAVSFAGMLLLSPLLIFAAIRVRMSSPGPIFFSQERVGFKGKRFMIHKFRSMCQDAEAEGPRLSFPGDPRVTPWGRVMRKWRIDELPQFINVLQGTMSIVGPRPHQPREVEKYQSHHRKVFAIKPGITGMAQVSGRSDLSFDEESRLDTWYIDHWSLWLDIVILLKTPFVIVRQDGAY